MPIGLLRSRVEASASIALKSECFTGMIYPALSVVTRPRQMGNSHQRNPIFEHCPDACNADWWNFETISELAQSLLHPAFA